MHTYTTYIHTYTHTHIHTYIHTYIHTEFSSSVEHIQTILQALLQLCQRNSTRVNEKSRQTMWLPVFDMVLSMPNKFKRSINNDLLDGKIISMTDLVM